MRVIQALTLGAALLATTAAASFAGDADVVKYRQKNMEIMSAHMNSIAAIVKGDVTNKDQLEAHAKGLSAAAVMAPGAFKTQAQTSESTAKPDVWADWAKVEAGFESLRTKADALAVAAAAGDQAAIGAAVGDIGKSCKSCHDNFRVKK